MQRDIDEQQEEISRLRCENSIFAPSALSPYRSMPAELVTDYPLLATNLLPTIYYLPTIYLPTSLPITYSANVVLVGLLGGTTRK